MEKKDDRFKGIIAALLLLLLLFTASVFMGLHYPDPPIPDEGVEIEFSGGSGSSGSEAGQQASETPEQTSRPMRSSQARHIATDKSRENPAVESGSQQKTPEKPTPTVDPSSLYKGKTGSTSGSSSGDNKGTGSGSGDGNTSGDGVGAGQGSGTGPNHSLVGRTATKLDVPTNPCNEYGKVVIEIRVDQYGEVKSAAYRSRGSTTTSSCLKKISIEAAKKSKFSVKLDAAIEQVGTITYNYTW
ncbi:MAG: hypothetical protein RQ866_02355 [Bacteroidales bacterium]|nr:hypothetical protein [Bacteroidales bacterium]